MEPNNAPQNQPESPAPAPAPVQPVAPVTAPASGNGSGFAIAALVLGIIAFLFGWLGFLNLFTAILAVVFGVVAMVKHQSKGMALAGLILGGIAVVASLIFGMFQLATLGGLQDAAKEAEQRASQNSQSSSATGEEWDFKAIYSQLTDGMSKTDAEALLEKPGEGCSESTSQYTGKIETCTYGGYKDGGSITVTYTNDKVSGKSKYEY